MWDKNDPQFISEPTDALEQARQIIKRENARLALNHVSNANAEWHKKMQRLFGDTNG